MIRFSQIAHNVRPLFPKLTAYFAAHRDVEFAYIFGSYGIEKETPMSDVDIAVSLKQIVPQDRYFDLRLEFMSDIVQILKTNEVDVIILNNADLILAYHTVSSRKLLFERDPAIRIVYETRILDRYFDSEPIRRIQQEYFKEHIQQGVIFG